MCQYLLKSSSVVQQNHQIKQSHYRVQRASCQQANENANLRMMCNTKKLAFDVDEINLYFLLI